jgi:hypothetical protein
LAWECAIYNANAAMAATAPRATADWENWRADGAALESKKPFVPALAAPTGTGTSLSFEGSAFVVEDLLVVPEVALLPAEEAL